MYQWNPFWWCTTTGTSLQNVIQKQFHLNSYSLWFSCPHPHPQAIQNCKIIKTYKTSEKLEITAKDGYQRGTEWKFELYLAAFYGVQVSTTHIFILRLRSFWPSALFCFHQNLIYMYGNSGLWMPGLPLNTKSYDKYVVHILQQFPFCGPDTI